MARIGIVGHEGSKFTPGAEARAKDKIRSLLSPGDVVVSGHCHLGGVDIWAEEVAAALGIPVLVHRPRVRAWGGPGGDKERKLKIAEDSDLVLVVVVRELPPGYVGMRFGECYHCRGRNPPHVKSGACWTAWQAKEREWRII